MCITSETCRAKSVIKKLALNNLHQAGLSKPTLTEELRLHNLCKLSFVYTLKRKERSNQTN